MESVTDRDIGPCISSPVFRLYLELSERRFRRGISPSTGSKHRLKLCADSHEQIQGGGIKIRLLAVEFVGAAIAIPGHFRVQRPF